MIEAHELNKLAKEIHEDNKSRGFWDEDVVNIHKYLLLIVSEVAEAQDADRKSRYANIEAFRDSTIKGDGFEKAFELYIKDSFEDEMADIFIRTMDFVAAMGINIGKHVEFKLRYNASRPSKHGKNY